MHAAGDLVLHHEAKTCSPHSAKSYWLAGERAKEGLAHTVLLTINLLMYESS